MLIGYEMGTRTAMSTLRKAVISGKL